MNTFAQIIQSIFFLQGALLPIGLGFALWYWWRTEQQATAFEQIMPKPRDSRKTQANILHTLPVLEPLNCDSCAAGVVLTKTGTHCPNCGRDAPAPADYTAVLELKTQVAQMFARATSHTKVAQFLTHSWVQTLFWALAALQFAVLLGVLVTTEERFFLESQLKPLLEVLGIAGFFAVFILALVYWMLGALSAELRRQVPALPSLPLEAGQPKTAACRTCGGTLEFSATDFAALCSYCNVENYRAEFTQTARANQNSQLEQQQSVVLRSLAIIAQYPSTVVILVVLLLVGFLGMGFLTLFK